MKTAGLAIYILHPPPFLAPPLSSKINNKKAGAIASQAGCKRLREQSFTLMYRAIKSS